MDTEKALLAAINDNQEDWPLYLVLADFYEEKGEDNLAKGFRYCGQNNYYPHAGSWQAWFGWSVILKDSNNYKRASLSKEMYQSLRERRQSEMNFWVNYPTYLDAIAALGEVL